MNLTVRPALETDWEAVARVYSLVQPQEPYTAQDVQKRDAEQRAWGYHAQTFVALDAAEAVGVGTYYQNPGSYHPQKYALELSVRPDRQGQGIGGALWRVMENDLRRLGAESARTLAREDHPLAKHFLTRRGFVGDKRYFTSALDVAAFDETPYLPLLARLEAQGVRVRTLAQMRQEGVPDLPERLHALMSDVRLDVPRSEPATPLSFQVFEEAVLGDHGLLPEAYLVAEQAGQFTGQTVLFRSDASPDLFTGLTGVKRDWRGQGIATGLKVHAVQVARAYGAPFIHTDNASDNAPMLAINDRMGFVRDPASVSYILRF